MNIRHRNRLADDVVDALVKDGLLPETEVCGECGMRYRPSEYHPYAACLMFKGCRDSRTVRANLEDVLRMGAQSVEHRQ